MTRARILLFASVLSLGSLAAACGGGPGNSYVPASQADAMFNGHVAQVVAIQYFNFTPRSVTIYAGQTVEWKWQDFPTPHNVTFAGFASPSQASGDYFHTFTTPGTFDYRCTLHEDMSGEVIVLP